MVQTASPSFSLADFLQLPETKPASEYLDGEIYQKPMPQGKHSLLQGEITAAINQIAKPQRIALALPELRCTFDGRSIVPDIAVLRWSRIPQDENGEIANTVADYPDWIVEILSPDQSLTKIVKKILFCLNSGCELGWIIDPQDRSLLVYPQGQQPTFLEEDDDLLPAPSFLPALNLTLGDILGFLKL